MLASERRWQLDLYEFEISLVYRVNFRNSQGHTVRLCKHRLQTNKSKEETKSAQTHYRIGKFVLAIFCFGSGIELKALCTSSMASTCS